MRPEEHKSRVLNLTKIGTQKVRLTSRGYKGLILQRVQRNGSPVLKRAAKTHSKIF